MEVDLSKKGGPEKAGKLFEKILLKTDNILAELGLPSTPYYQGLLEFEAVLWDKELDDLINLLCRESNEKKAADPKAEIDILVDAMNTNRDPMFILPQIGIATHTYTLWVYNVILLKHEDTPVNVLAELKKSMEGDLLNQIGIIDSRLVNNFEDAVSSLEKNGLRYIRQYAENRIEDLKAWGFRV
jgi:hypothetical protein